MPLFREMLFPSHPSLDVILHVRPQIDKRRIKLQGQLIIWLILILQIAIAMSMAKEIVQVFDGKSNPEIDVSKLVTEGVINDLIRPRFGTPRMMETNGQSMAYRYAFDIIIASTFCQKRCVFVALVCLAFWDVRRQWRCCEILAFSGNQFSHQPCTRACFPERLDISMELVGD